MAGIMMLTDPAWFAFQQRNVLSGLAIFYASPHKRTKRGPFDPLFCVRPGSKPRSIVGVGRIRAQPIIEQDSAWEQYGSSLGADTEAEWRAQASAVLMNSRKTYEGKMLAIELVDFQTFPSPVSPEAVGLTDKGWSDKKEATEDATTLLMNLLETRPKHSPPDRDKIDHLKRQFDELWSKGLPRTTGILRQVQRVLKTYERPSSITRYVKRTRGATCQLCGELGFVKRNGTRYCEVHHLFHLSKNPPPNCLDPEYLVVLCASCHRRLHYADAGEPEREECGWRVRVDEIEYRFTVEAAAPNQSLQHRMIPVMHE